MSKERTQFVMARRYQLTVRDTRTKTGYKVDGSKELTHDLKFIPRAWVEEKNQLDKDGHKMSNELYVIDEEATAAAYIQRAKNIEKQAIENQRKNISMADMVEAIGGKGLPPKPTSPDVSKAELSAKDEENEALKKRIAELEADKTNTIPEGYSDTPSEDWTVEALKEYCDEKGIEYHAASKQNKLLELIISNK